MEFDGKISLKNKDILYLIRDLELNISFEPIRISSKGKVKVVDTCHITVAENKDYGEGKQSKGQRNYVF